MVRPDKFYPIFFSQIFYSHSTLTLPFNLEGTTKSNNLLLVYDCGVQISVIVPVFNGERYLKETLDSILIAGSNIYYEVIVVNDGSWDATEEIVESFEDPRVSYIRTENLGEAHAVNLGLKHARGKYCLVLSHDDPIIDFEHLVHDAVAIMEEDEAIGCVYPDWRIINKDGKVVRVVRTQNFDSRVLYGKMECLPGPGSIFRTRIAIQIGGRSDHLRYTSDYEFWLRYSEEIGFKRNPKVLANWRMHPGSTSVKDRSIQMLVERISVVSQFQSRHEDISALKPSAISHAYLSASIIGVRIEGFPFKSYAVESVRIFPKILLSKSAKRLTILLLVPRRIIKFGVTFLGG
jgi:glycosyltransferase involved in cell wall biosynthesis